MGKRMLDAIYMKLGVRRRWTTWPRASRRSATRPYVDKTRVGIYGTSYGGYASAMMLLRHPGSVRRRRRRRRR